MNAAMPETVNTNAWKVWEDVPAWVPRDWQEGMKQKLSALNDDESETLIVAVALGWSIIEDLASPRGGLTILSPDEKHRHHFPLGKRVKIGRVRDDVVKYADRLKLFRMQELDFDVRKYMAELGDDHGIDIRVIRPAVEPEPAPEPTEKYLVETKPMLASRGKDQGYESKIAIERHWSDGSIDYKCILCDHSSEKRLSVRSHWRAHLNSGEAEPVGFPAQGEVMRVDVPNAARYTPRAYRVEALADILKALMEGDADPEAVAKAALTWVHEQSNQGTRLSGEAEELNDGEILARIRTLLDRGENAKQAAMIAELQQQNQALQQELMGVQTRIGELEHERDKYRDLAARAAGDLQSLRELLNGLGAYDVDEEETA